MMTDPIADMLTRIRNAQSAHKLTVVVPFSKLKLAVAEILYANKYIGAIETIDTPKKILELTLLYCDKQPVITSLTRESKPGHRMYRKADELPKVLNGYGIAIVSTSRGMMTNKEAVKQGIGGEVLCSVY